MCFNWQSRVTCVMTVQDAGGRVMNTEQQIQHTCHCVETPCTHTNLKYPWMFWSQAEQNLVFAYRSELRREWIEYTFSPLLPSQKPSKRIPAWYALSARKGFWAGNYIWRSVRFRLLSSMPWIITKKYMLAYCLL